MKLTTKILILLIITLVLSSCKQETEQPKLVVVISIDHLAHFTYDHYRPAFTQGFKWLHDHGISFENAHHEHGYCATGPGHFVLGSGLHPGPAGILGNYWYDRNLKKNVYCVEDSTANALDIPAYQVSYGPVNGTTYGDWLKSVSPESKVFAVACKDRSSIMMAGKNPDLAVWYNWRGNFTTTDYYTDTIPQWLFDFNSENDILSYRDSLWTTNIDAALLAEYTHGDSFYGESDRFENETYSPTLPIGFESTWDDAKVNNEFASRPWMDRMTLDLAERTITENKMGMDRTPDVLSIGLSTMDLLSHYYGPFSHEVMDHLMKLDGYMMEFINFLDTEVGLENVVFALSSDHGGLPLPEHRSHIQNKYAGRVNEDAYLATRAKAYGVIDSLYGHHDFIHRNGSSYYYNFAMMDSMEVDPAVVDSMLQTYMESVEGVYRLYTKAELLAATPAKPLAYRLRNFMHPELSPDLYTLLEEGWLFRTPYGTSHSTPYEYDSHVPLVFSSLEFAQVTRMDSVATVDLAPTIGDVVGAPPLNAIDGKSLFSLLAQ